MFHFLEYHLGMFIALLLFQELLETFLELSYVLLER